MSNSVQSRTAHVLPRSDSQDVLGLAEELNELSKTNDLMAEYLEEHLGLNRRQLRVLSSVALSAGPDSSRNRDEDLDVLSERHLIIDDGEEVAITERGKVVLDQVEAIRIRLADRLVTELGPTQIRALRTTMQHLLATAPQATGPTT